MKKKTRLWNGLELMVFIGLLILAIKIINCRHSFDFDYPQDSLLDTLMFGVGMLLCAAVGIFSYTGMQRSESKNSAYFTLAALILLLIILNIEFHSLWIDYLGFTIFNAAGFVAAIEVSEQADDIASSG